MNHILIVEDDLAFRDTLAKALKGMGFRITSLIDPSTIASTVAVHRPNVILLDMMFASGESGLEICKQLRTWTEIPIIIISILDDEDTKVSVLDAGADDYLCKPFGLNELLARIRVVERRLKHSPSVANSPSFAIGDFMIDFASRRATLKDKPLRLTKKEYSLVKALADARGRLVTYDQLLGIIWNNDTTVDRSRLRALVMQLRHKLDEDVNNPQFIITEPGVGYRVNWEMVRDGVQFPINSL
jgi:two-component system, OmpR family, KDP operon response regulator KdpE